MYGARINDIWPLMRLRKNDKIIYCVIINNSWLLLRSPIRKHDMASDKVTNAKTLYTASKITNTKTLCMAQELTISGL